MGPAEFVLPGSLAGFALIAIGTLWSVRYLEAAETLFGVRRSAIALIMPAFGPAGYAVVDALLFHHSLRVVSAGFSVASAAALLIAGGVSLYLGIRSINANIFQYFLLSIPIPTVSLLTIADSEINRFEAGILILLYILFVSCAWWMDRFSAARRYPLASKDGRSIETKLAALTAGCATTLAGAVLLITCARDAMSAWPQLQLGSLLAGSGTIVRISVFAWASMRQGRSELAVAGILGSLAFDTTITLGVFGLTARSAAIDPSAHIVAAIVTLGVPALLFPWALRQTKHWQSDDRGSSSDAHLDNVFAWRNLKRDLSNFQLLHHRNVDGNLVTGMNSGTHWLTVMLATAIAEQHGLELPKYFSFDAAGDLVGVPKALVRRSGIPAIALSHNHPAALVASPLVRRLFPYPKQVVLVRDIRDVLISAYVKWMPNGEVPFSEFVRGDPGNRRGYLCDVWWYLSYLNRWGDVKTGAPNDTLVVRYEDMVDDPAFWLHRISEHFGLNLSEKAVQAGLTLRDKEAALAKLDPNNSERVIAAPEAKAAVCFSAADLRELRNILSRHLRYDYGYDYGLDATSLSAVRRVSDAEECSDPQAALQA